MVRWITKERDNLIQVRSYETEQFQRLYDYAWQWIISWDSINGDNVRGDCVTEGREGWGRIGGREIAGRWQRVSPTTNQVGDWRNWRKGWGAFSRIVRLSSKTPIRALQNFEWIETEARPYWRNKKEAGVQILSSGKHFIYRHGVSTEVTPLYGVQA